jgi:hypothetical protein
MLRRFATMVADDELRLMRRRFGLTESALFSIGSMDPAHSKRASRSQPNALSLACGPQHELGRLCSGD